MSRSSTDESPFREEPTASEMPAPEENGGAESASEEDTSAFGEPPVVSTD